MNNKQWEKRMDLIDRLEELASRIKRQLDHVKTEEGVKTAFILPFIQSLGYDVFNPAEVIPELTADHGVKKGEKVDYAIRIDNKIVILIECKQVDAPLEAKYAGQLFRYFSVTDAKFGVLTDGIRYLFFTDLEKENKMDERPFFEFNMFSFNEGDVDELKKFTRTSFDLNTIISTASNLKYTKALITEIRKELATPSDDLVKVFASRVYEGRFTAQVKEQFTELTRKAFEQFVMERINSKIKSAFEEAPQGAVNTTTGIPPEEEPDILTTEEEREGHRIIQAIVAEIADVDRVFLRDAKSYCAILFDDNNRKPICRLYFSKKKGISVGVFNAEGEQKFDIQKPSELFKHKAQILFTVNQYLAQ